MGSGRFLLGFILISILAGTLFAMNGATPVISGTQARWSGSPAGAITSEGGNISAINVNAITLTDRWTAFYGNVTGNIVLGNSSANGNMFNWTYTTAASGKICISTNDSMGFLSPTAAVASAIDAAFGLGSTNDNAAGTFNGTCPQLNLSTGSIASPIMITHKGASSFKTCAITADGATAKNNTAFCTLINSSGTSYSNLSANYEVMAPTTPGTGAETYYFYAELG